MLEMLKRLPIVGTIISSAQTVLICAAVLIVTNAGTGLIAYVKGHNAAAAKCKINSIIRERDEAKRDRDNAVNMSKFFSSKAAELEAKQAAREKKEAEDAQNVKPIDGCVVPAIPARRLRR